MTPEDEFSRLMKRIAEGDESACDEFFRDYFDHLLRVVRSELRDRKLRRQFDSVDVCQSVLMGLFRGIEQGSIRLDTPENLQALFTAMAQNKVAMHARRLHAARRDVRRTADRAIDEFGLASADCEPCDEAAHSDLSEMFYARLTVGQATVLEMRGAGKRWREIAAATGTTPDAARMCMARLLALASTMLDQALIGEKSVSRSLMKRRPK